MSDYNDGEWHIWNGGECPVHPRSVVQIQLADETRLQVEAEMTDCLTGAGNHLWDHESPIGANDIIAFRVLKEHREPREFWIVAATGDAWETEARAKTVADGLVDPTIIHVREVLE